MKVEMTLHSDYVPNWKTAEGIRELIQNARDGEKEYNALMSVKYRRSSGTLIVRNDNVNIPREALLIGYSTKRNNEQLIGQFGEGLNLGILALVRDGMDVDGSVGPPSISNCRLYSAMATVSRSISCCQPSIRRGFSSIAILFSYWRRSSSRSWI